LDLSALSPHLGKCPKDKRGFISGHQMNPSSSMAERNRPRQRIGNLRSFSLDKTSDELYFEVKLKVKMEM